MKNYPPPTRWFAREKVGVVGVEEEAGQDVERGGVGLALSLVVAIEALQRGGADGLVGGGADELAQSGEVARRARLVAERELKALEQIVERLFHSQLLLCGGRCCGPLRREGREPQLCCHAGILTGFHILFSLLVAKLWCFE